MTWAHPPDSLLAALASGEVGSLAEPELVRVALHVDACPACATRATSLDPMAHALASTSEAEVPAGLAAGILAALAETPSSTRQPHRPVALAACLLGVALALMLSAGAPGELLVGLLTVTGALIATGVSIGANLGSPVATATFVAGVGLAASVVTVRKASRRRSAA